MGGAESGDGIKAVLTSEWHPYPCRSFFSLPKGMKPPEMQQTRLTHHSEAKRVELSSGSSEGEAEDGGSASTPPPASAPEADEVVMGGTDEASTAAATRVEPKRVGRPRGSKNKKKVTEEKKETKKKGKKMGT